MKQVPTVAAESTSEDQDALVPDGSAELASDIYT